MISKKLIRNELLVVLLTIVVFITVLLKLDSFVDITQNLDTMTQLTENDQEFAYDYRALMPPEKFDTNWPPSLPFISGDTVRAFADHIIDNFPNPKFNPAAVKAGDIIYVKTDYIAAFFQQCHGSITNPYILLTHNSDYSVCNEQSCKYLNDTKLLVWYGENINFKHPKLRAIPIGVVNVIPPQNQPPWYANITVLHSVSRRLQRFKERKTDIYVNFQLNTNNNRTKTLKYFIEEFGNDSSTHIATTRSTWLDYMTQLGDTKFVISPPGNGMDCFRTWEALIMGAVPIVMQSNLNELYENMPIIVVHDWREVTKEMLLRYQKTQLQLGAGGVPKRPKIWARYWREQLMVIQSPYRKKT